MLHPEVDLDHLGIRLHLIDTAFGQNAAFVQHRHPARESAAAAGDSYPTTRVLSADGVVSLISCMMGNPFINAVYIGMLIGSQVFQETPRRHARLRDRRRSPDLFRPHAQ